MPRAAWAKNALGWAALAAGLAGLAAAVLPPVWIGPPGMHLRDEVIGLVSDAAAYHTALRTWEWIAAALGLIAIVLAVLAAIRKQHRLLIAFALGLGAVALLWEYIATALFVALVLVAIVAISS
jgi:hypothetical protein